MNNYQSSVTLFRRGSALRPLTLALLATLAQVPAAPAQQPPVRPAAPVANPSPKPLPTPIPDAVPAVAATPTAVTTPTPDPALGTDTPPAAAADATPPELLPTTPSALPLTLTPDAGGLLAPPAPVPTRPSLPADTSQALDVKFERSLVVPRPVAISTGKPVGLLDAVRLTLLQSPQINLSQQDTVLARAALQIATSQFDSRLSGSVAYRRTQEEVTPEELRKRIAQREGKLDALQAITTQRLGLEASRDQGTLLGGQRNGGNVADLQGQLNDIFTSITLQGASPQQQANIQSLQRTISSEVARQNQITINQLLVAEQRTKADLRKAGVQSADKSNAFDENLTLNKQLRNGILLQPFATYNNTRNGETIGTARARIGFTVNVPLSRGLGESDTAARERAAKIDYQASLLQFRHITSQNVYGTALAYWSCVAAQERLALLLRSERIATTLVDLSRALVAADEQAPAELNLILARQRETTATRYAGELALLDARQQLALQIGLEAKDIPLLLTAVDRFPDIVPFARLDTLRAEVLAQDAIGLRADRQAASKLEVSGKVLAESARLEQRPRVDFNTRAAWSSPAEGNAFAGYFNAYGRNYTGPSITGTLSLDIPFANNQFKGQYLQSLASYNQRVTRSADLTRNIVSSVVFSLGAVRSTIAQLEQAGAAAEYYRRALDNEYQKYKLRSSTLIDAIQIEQRLTSAQLQFVDSELQYAQSLARLRFETGTLLPPTPGVLAFDRADLVTLPVVRPLPAVAVIPAK